MKQFTHTQKSSRVVSFPRFFSRERSHMLPFSASALLRAAARRARGGVRAAASAAPAAAPADDGLQVTVNGEAVTVPKGSSVMQACDAAGVDIPRLVEGEGGGTRDDGARGCAFWGRARRPRLPPPTVLPHARMAHAQWWRRPKGGNVCGERRAIEGEDKTDAPPFRTAPNPRRPILPPSTASATTNASPSRATAACAWSKLRNRPNPSRRARCLLPRA